MEEKSTSIYMVVRVDISYSADMNAEEAKELAMENFDYDFKMPEGYGIGVDYTEICGEHDGSL